MATSIPGYIPLGELMFEEFEKLSPTFQINNQAIKLKYCPTCKIIREPRSFHCIICGYCVIRHDHHCGFIGNCIGKNNTNKFVYFLSSIVVHCLIIFISTLVKLVNLTLKLNLNKWNTNDYFGLFILIISGLFLFTISGILILQIYLISNNLTTNEFMRKKDEKNFYDEGCSNNFREVFCFNKN